LSEINANFVSRPQYSDIKSYPRIWSEVSWKAKWAVLPLAPNEFQKVNKKSLVKCGGASILLGYDAASLNKCFPTFRKDLVPSVFQEFFFPRTCKSWFFRTSGKAFPTTRRHIERQRRT